MTRIAAGDPVEAENGYQNARFGSISANLGLSKLAWISMMQSGLILL